MITGINSMDTPLSSSDHAPQPPEQFRQLVDYFKLFADESRLKILWYLSQHQEVNVRTLCSNLQQTQPAVSHHLGLLKTAGLVKMRREGKHNYYHVEQEEFSKVNGILARLFPNFGDDDLEQSGQTG